MFVDGGDGGAFGHAFAEVEFGFAAALRADGDQAADDVEDDVRAASGGSR